MAEFVIADCNAQGLTVEPAPELGVAVGETYQLAPWQVKQIKNGINNLNQQSP